MIDHTQSSEPFFFWRVSMCLCRIAPHNMTAITEIVCRKLAHQWNHLPMLDSTLCNERLRICERLTAFHCVSVILFPFYAPCTVAKVNIYCIWVFFSLFCFTELFRMISLKPLSLTPSWVFDTEGGGTEHLTLIFDPTCLPFYNLHKMEGERFFGPHISVSC